MKIKTKATKQIKFVIFSFFYLFVKSRFELFFLVKLVTIHCVVKMCIKTLVNTIANILKLLTCFAFFLLHLFADILVFPKRQIPTSKVPIDYLFNCTCV